MVYSFEPIYNDNSRLLILGTMPSPASLAAGMYYSHPRNSFWPIMRDLTGDDPGKSNESRRAFLLRHGVALWDTLRLCEREGSPDGNIKGEQPNAVAELVAHCAKISAVFLNGERRLNITGDIMRRKSSCRIFGFRRQAPRTRAADMIRNWMPGVP